MNPLRFAVAFACLAFGASARAVEPPAIDALFREWDQPTSPGLALAVIRDGRIIYERGYGQAQLPPAEPTTSRAVPITPDTSFYIGSVSKQFAAACIALLHQRGSLSLDDDIRRYVPEIPDYGARITLRHCVHHTSGLRDYLALRDLAGEDPNATFGNDYVLALLARQQALNFPPGSRHLYSNSGYFVLSLVVQRVTGKSLREFAAENIFGPLGMKTAQFRDRHTQPIPHRADGYTFVPSKKTYRVNNPNFDVVGAGGVFMTLRDFLAWDQNFYAPRVGDAAFISLLQTPGQLNDGTILNYAFGLTVGNYRGLAIVEHSGAYGGFRAHALRFPAQRVSVVGFGNLSSLTPGRLVRQVADLYLADRFTAPAAPEISVPATPPAAKKSPSPRAPADFARFTGTFRSTELATECRIHVDANSSQLQLFRSRAATTPIPLVPTGDRTFIAGAVRLQFTELPNGDVPSFTVSESRASGLVFVRDTPASQN